jgi:2-amino-4-hydroxy-6-hydroxymethyldihydropteridine diphosphokinase
MRGHGTIGRMFDAIVGLGSNLGSREAFVVLAAKMLAADPAIELVARSRMYVTPPIGPPQPDFVNAAVRIASELPARAILDRCLAIERALGRVREARWGPRTIDLDLLYWEGGAIDEPDLTVPHPRLIERAFALAPLLDVAPELEPSLGPALDHIGRPRASLWSEPTGGGELVTVRALDDADALAIALSKALGGGVGSTARLVAGDARGLVREAKRLGSVVLERFGDRIEGWVSGPEIGNFGGKTWDLVDLGQGRCVLRRA